MRAKNFSFWFNPSRHLGLSLVLLVVLGLAACGAAAPTMDRSASEAGAPAPVPAQPVQPPGDASGEMASADDILSQEIDQAQATSRVIIYTGNITLVVRDTGEAVAGITALATEKGGYVSGSDIYQSNDVPRGTMTIRVPAERYQETLAALRALAVRVERESSGTQDVTEEFTDLQARQENLEVTEKALQELLAERQRTGSTGDILEVYRELTNVRGQIEQIEGRLRYLSNQSALSTITIELVPDILSQPVSVAGWEPRGVAKEAVQALVAALQGLTTLLIWLVILVVPLLIVMLIPVVLVGWGIRSIWRRRSKRAIPDPAKVTTETPPADKS